MFTFTFSKKKIQYYKNKNIYNSVMKQLNSYRLYNKNKEFIRFAKDAIIG